MPKKSYLWSQHFTLLTDEDGKSLRKATCNYCKDGKEHETKSGTTNLWRHLTRSHPQEVQAAAAAAAEEGAAEQQQPSPQDEVMQDMGPAAPICGAQEAAATAPMFIELGHVQADEATQMLFEEQSIFPAFQPPPLSSSLTLSQPSAGSLDRNPAFEEARKHLARMLALKGYDPSIVEDDCFKSFVGSLNPEFRVPSRIDIEEMCDGAFDEARRDFDAIKRYRSLALLVGTAKTIEAGEVVYITCHSIDDKWNLHKLVLDARVQAAHFDAIDAPILGVQVVRDDAIIDYVINVISEYGIKDRLSMVVYERMDDQFHTRLKDYLEARDSETDPRITKISCSSAIYVDNVLHTIARYFLPIDDELAKTMHDAICHLGFTRQKRQELLSTLGLDNPWAYGERWYACYCSLKIIWHKKNPSIINSTYPLLLCDVLGAIHGAIQKISESTSRPTSNLCLGELFNVRKVLVNNCEKRKGYLLLVKRKDVIDAVEKATRHLDQMIQDSYLIWSIPLAMDPRHKLKSCLNNFSEAFGSSDADNYISQIKLKIVDLCTCRRNIFLHAIESDEHRRKETTAQLDAYLKDPLADEQADILMWWKANERNYPRLAWMASQALSVPTCSKLCSHQMAHVMSILRGYSKGKFGDESFFSKDRR